MPFPFVSFRSELEPTTRKELDATNANLTEFLSKEHKPDGTHGDITADSVTISGDLSVLGSAGFEDVTLNSLVANDIQVADLAVSDAATISPVDAVQALTISPTTLTEPAGMAFINTGGTLTLGINRSAGGPFTGTAYDAVLLYTSTHDLTVLASGGSLNLAATGTVKVGGFTNQLTVDGATGDTAIAGTLTGALATFTKNQNATSTWTFQNTDNTNSSSRATAKVVGGTVDLRMTAVATSQGNLGTVSAHQLVLFTNNTDAITIDTSQKVTFAGAIRFATLANGSAIFDGSGNVSNFTSGISTTLTWLDGNGFTNHSLTMVNGFVTAAS